MAGCVKSAFSDSRLECSRKAFVHVLPPKVHTVALATGGLRRLFNNVKERKPPHCHNHDTEGAFTDNRGRFQPPEGTLLANRYRVVDIICCRGQSAILFRAQDLFRSDMTVVIKALHDRDIYFDIGFQEAHTLRRLACADPHGFSHTVRLLNTFLHGRHFCLVFEALDPKPVTHVLFSLHLAHDQVLRALRKVTLQLLQVVGFLRQNNTIHADLKPENILLHSVRDLNSLRVIDFGNAINHVHREMSLYYKEFEVQTLLYRAPEVLFGIPFGAEIDMWSLGCILAEIYLGQPLLHGTNKRAIIQSMVDVLGPLPHRVYCRGKFFDQLEGFTQKEAAKENVTVRLLKRFQQRFQPDYAFTSFLAGLLEYDPDKRLSPAEAAQHPFLAPELCVSYILPSSGMKESTTSTLFVSENEYSMAPEVSSDIRRQHPSSLDLLRMGTGMPATSVETVSELASPKSQNQHGHSTDLLKIGREVASKGCSETNPDASPSLKGHSDTYPHTSPPFIDAASTEDASWHKSLHATCHAQQMSDVDAEVLTPPDSTHSARQQDKREDTGSGTNVEFGFTDSCDRDEASKRSSSFCLNSAQNKTTVKAASKQRTETHRIGKDKNQSSMLSHEKLMTEEAQKIKDSTFDLMSCSRRESKGSFKKKSAERLNETFTVEEESRTCSVSKNVVQTKRLKEACSITDSIAQANTQTDEGTSTDRCRKTFSVTQTKPGTTAKTQSDSKIVAQADIPTGICRANDRCNETFSITEADPGNLAAEKGAVCVEPHVSHNTSHSAKHILHSAKHNLRGVGFTYGQAADTDISVEMSFVEGTEGDMSGTSREEPILLDTSSEMNQEAEEADVSHETDHTESSSASLSYRLCQEKETVVHVLPQDSDDHIASLTQAKGHNIVTQEGETFVTVSEVVDNSSDSSGHDEHNVHLPALTSDERKGKRGQSDGPFQLVTSSTDLRPSAQQIQSPTDLRPRRTRQSQSPTDLRPNASAQHNLSAPENPDSVSVTGTAKSRNGGLMKIGSFSTHVKDNSGRVALRVSTDVALSQLRALSDTRFPTGKQVSESIVCCENLKTKAVSHSPVTLSRERARPDTFLDASFESDDSDLSNSSQLRGLISVLARGTPCPPRRSSEDEDRRTSERNRRPQEVTVNKMECGSRQSSKGDEDRPILEEDRLLQDFPEPSHVTASHEGADFSETINKRVSHAGVEFTENVHVTASHEGTDFTETVNKMASQEGAELTENKDSVRSEIFGKVVPVPLILPKTDDRGSESDSTHYSKPKKTRARQLSVKMSRHSSPRKAKRKASDSFTKQGKYRVVEHLQYFSSSYTLSPDAKRRVMDRRRKSTGVKLASPTGRRPVREASFTLRANTEQAQSGIEARVSGKFLPSSARKVRRPFPAKKHSPVQQSAERKKDFVSEAGENQVESSSTVKTRRSLRHVQKMSSNSSSPKRVSTRTSSGKKISFEERRQRSRSSETRDVSDMVTAGQQNLGQSLQGARKRLSFLRTSPRDCSKRKHLCETHSVSAGIVSGLHTSLRDHSTRRHQYKNSSAVTGNVTPSRISPRDHSARKCQHKNITVSLENVAGSWTSPSDGSMRRCQLANSSDSAENIAGPLQVKTEPESSPEVVGEGSTGSALHVTAFEAESVDPSFSPARKQRKLTSSAQSPSHSQCQVLLVEHPLASRRPRTMHSPVTVIGSRQVSTSSGVQDVLGSEKEHSLASRRSRNRHSPATVFDKGQIRTTWGVLGSEKDETSQVGEHLHTLPTCRQKDGTSQSGEYLHSEKTPRLKEMSSELGSWVQGSSPSVQCTFTPRSSEGKNKEGNSENETAKTSQAIECYPHLRKSLSQRPSPSQLKQGCDGRRHSATASRPLDSDLQEHHQFGQTSEVADSFDSDSKTVQETEDDHHSSDDDIIILV